MTGQAQTGVDRTELEGTQHGRRSGQDRPGYDTTVHGRTRNNRTEARTGREKTEKVQDRIEQAQKGPNKPEHNRT